ncbi:MAG: hypothetical protein RIC55_21120 [Pirellulaceae bacterium]
MLQEALALTVVFVAGAYLTRRVWLLAVKGRGGGCGGGGCAACPGNQSADATSPEFLPPGFVSLHQISDTRTPRGE